MTLLQQRAAEMSAREQHLKMTAGVCPRPAPEPEVLAAGPLAVANVALGLLGLFKTDQTITGADVTLDEFAVAALVARELLALRPGKVVYPPSMHIFLDAAGPDSELTKKHQELVSMRSGWRDSTATITELKDKVDAKVAAAGTSAECKKVLGVDSQQLGTLLKELAAAGTVIDEVLTALTKQEAGTGLSLIDKYTKAAQLAVLTRNGYTLQLKAIAAGGNTHVRKNLFSSKISFSGGSVLSYMLFTPAGVMTYADTIPWYAGDVDAADMKKGLQQLQ